MTFAHVSYLSYSQSSDLSADRLLYMRARCPSRRNLALKIAELRFSQEERLTSNCSGTRGKTALDRQELEQIRTDVFRYCSLVGKENFEDAWRDCRRAIDEWGRLLNYRRKNLADTTNTPILEQ